MVNIETIKNREPWEKFLLSQMYQPFFQSWRWAEVQEKLGNTTLRLGIFDAAEKHSLVGICLVVEVKARRGHFFHLRHGPVFSLRKGSYSQSLLTYLKAEAKKREVSFLRLSPLLPVGTTLRGCIRAPIHNMDAENCWILPLEKSEEDLLKDMRKTTRYLIRRGQALGLEVTKTKASQELPVFLRLYKKTVAKHGFVPHRGIEEEFEEFAKDDNALLLFVRRKKKVLAGGLVILYGNQAVYHHGASDPKYDTYSPSYLLQWEAIREAKRRRKKVYNFWGIAPDNKPRHPWRGLTLFKTGFGGRRLNFAHAQDLVLSPWYWKTYLIESATKLLKGY